MNERQTLSDINLLTSSIPPSENDPTLQALYQVDKINRAHAHSFVKWRKLEEERYEREEERFLIAENERRISRIKAWGTFICSVIAAIGGATAAILAAIR